MSVTPFIGSGHVVLELFAGHGATIAIHHLGAAGRGVESWADARETRALNGFETVYEDAWNVEAAAELEFDTIAGGPPCQLFSSAGKGKGRKLLPDILRAIEDGSYQSVAELRRLVAEVADGDDGVFLVLMPLHYIWRYRPTFVMLEQVRAVLPIWQAYLSEMAKWGYGGETRVVRFEQYGVPQTRQRAILLARHESAGLGPASIPAPTHSRFHEKSPERLDAGVEKWISMREALGWEVDRPAPTVTGGGASTEGRNPSRPAGGRLSRPRCARTTAREATQKREGSGWHRSPPRPSRARRIG